VRPAKTIITSLLKAEATLAWPTRSPSPAANHQRDRHDPPRDPEHGEQRAELVRKDRPQRIADQVAKDHVT
jgi:hypothetical protein